MKGQQLNTICKTINVITDVCRISPEIRAIDNSHVMMLRVNTIQGGPVFEVIGEGGIDVEQILKMKIDKNADFNVSIDDYKLKFVCDDTAYTFPITDSSIIPDPKVIDFMTLPRNEYRVDAGKLAKALKDVKCLSENIALECRDDGLHAVGYDDYGSRCDTRVSSEEGHYPMIKSLFNVAYLSDILNVVPKVVTLYVGNNHPLTMRWADEWNLYEVHLAPTKVEEDE